METPHSDNYLRAAGKKKRIFTLFGVNDAIKLLTVRVSDAKFVKQLIYNPLPNGTFFSVSIFCVVLHKSRLFSTGNDSKICKVVVLTISQSFGLHLKQKKNIFVVETRSKTMFTGKIIGYKKAIT